MKQKFFLLIFSVIMVLVACQKKEDEKVYQYQSINLPTETSDYKASFDAAFSRSSSLPTTIPQVFNFPAENKVTNAGATLGRVLFYDKLLSENNTTACASCHQQSNAFSDGGKQFSTGFAGEKTTRNSMAIVNTADNGFYFWDGRTSTLEMLALQPVRNHIEMGLDKIVNLEKKLAQAPYYNDLFKKAFGSTEITKEKVSKALSQFVHSLVSRNSKFDLGQKTNFSNFSAAEKRGEQLFQKTLYCGQCHNGKDFDGAGSSFGWGDDNNLNFSSANVGLDKNYQDDGFGLKANDEFSRGVFKVPSLRNVALTGPYMHDGRFKTLEDVINHYSDGVQNHPNLDSRIRFFNQRSNWNGGGVDTTQNRHIRLVLTKQQKTDLIEFLKTLTDKTFIEDKKYASPFQ
jgi:cytochrome c peroxidase